jgi:hypothetical protein
MMRVEREVANLGQCPTRERMRAIKPIIPRAKLEEVLESWGRGESFCRRLPGWFMLWFVVALGLFCRDSYRQVFRCLQSYRGGRTPGRSSLCAARQRLGLAPLRSLAMQAICLLGKPQPPGAFYRGMRLMSVDGFAVDLPHTPAKERVFGRPGTGRAPGALPQARVLSLCQTGSHVLWRSLMRSIRIGELTTAYRLLLAEISQEVIEEGRNRSNPRVLKRKLSRWEKKKPKHRRYPQPAKEFRQAMVLLN